jgi:uncharacterized protein YutE (UPF0331/DUF86 family)
VYPPAAERNFQVAIQAALDIASMILSDQYVTLPHDYAELFPKLAEMGVLPADFAQGLVNMARFRNVLVHLYLTVDPQRVYNYIQHNLDDLDLFARYIAEYLATQPSSET